MRITKKQLIRLIREQYVDQKHSDIKKMLDRDKISSKPIENFDDYLNQQFNKISPISNETISFQFHSNGRKTNYINLDKESAKFLINWLKKIYKKLN